ncbi:MAG: hypothetical protein PF448_12560 [Bacteroidales bacterium]|jgi:hypothetical protein|nr:hypothetical protein [Bacteroidales bacterium]
MSLNRIVLFLFLGLTLASCQTKQKGELIKKSDYQNLNSFLNEYDESLSTYKYVLTLSSHGCMTCNRSFAAFAERFAYSDSVLIVLFDSGARIDISPFKGNNNTVDDYRLKILEHDLEAVSLIYKIGESSIDTVITISADNIEQILNKFPEL